jgi:hypothetical protein
MDFFPYIIGIAVVIIALVIIIGPTGKTREKIENIEAGKDLSLSEIYKKMTGFKNDYLRNKEEGNRAKADTYQARYLKYKDMWEEEIKKRPKEYKDLQEKWKIREAREAYINSQEMPSDDALERNKKLIEKKFRNIRKLDATCGSGTLNCPDVPIWKDSSKTESAGKMSHEEWVVIMDQVGDGTAGMFHVKRRSDKREGWVEGKYLKEIYTKEKLDNLKLKEPGSGKKDDEDDDDFD